MPSFFLAKPLTAPQSVCTLSLLFLAKCLYSLLLPSYSVPIVSHTFWFVFNSSPILPVALTYPRSSSPSHSFASRRPHLRSRGFFIRKLQICSIIFDFSDALNFFCEKEVKCQTLLKLVDFTQSGSGRIHKKVQEELICAIFASIFRYLALASRENTSSEGVDPEEDPYLDPAWPLLYAELICFDTNFCSWDRYCGM